MYSWVSVKRGYVMYGGSSVASMSGAAGYRLLADGKNGSVYADLTGTVGSSATNHAAVKTSVHWDVVDPSRSLAGGMHLSANIGGLINEDINIGAQYGSGSFLLNASASTPAMHMIASGAYSTGSANT